jgi:hypothetical protein
VEPDLRNLSAHYAGCSEGDLIILVTDGIHDNLGNLIILII